MAKTLWLICMILTQTASFSHNQKCTRIRGVKNNVIWPETTEDTLSEPPCVNEHHEFLRRKCSNGEWEEEPLCFYIQEPPPNCPEDFVYSEKFTICYKIINQTFPPRCPFEDNLPYSSYKGLMNNNGPFWLPVARNLSNGLGFLYWTEASFLYQSYFNSISVGTIKDKNCVLYYNSSYIESASCNGHHLSICAYKPLNLLNSQLCPNLCAQSDFPVKSSCFCYSKSISDFSPKAEFLKLYQNSIYQKITNDTCYIGLKKNSEYDYIWTESKLNLNYTYWSPSTIFKNTFIYGASTSEGWILAEEDTLKCALVEKEKEMVAPKLDLKLGVDKQFFTLSVNDFRGLKMIDSENVLYCFTDAGSLDLITRYLTLDEYPVDENEKKYIFEALDDGPGAYWCESFEYLDMKRITSNTIFLPPQTSYFEFVAILKIGYDQKTNPLSQDIIDLLKETLFAKFNSEEVPYKPRVMKILDLDEDNRQIWLNIHLSQTKTIFGTDHSQQYLYVKRILEKYTNQITKCPIEIAKFLSAQYCIATKTKLTWSETPIHTVAYPKELCLKKDGSRLSRLCQGDFYDGAQWLGAHEDCKIYKKSRYTDDLLVNVNLNIEDALIFLESLQVQSFQPVDLFLISRILEKCVDDANKIDTEKHLEFINNLLDTDRDVLKQAQNEFNATDRILRAIAGTFANNSNALENLFLQKENIVLAMMTDMYSEISGIITTKTNGIFFVSPTHEDITVTNIEETRDLVSAIWLDKSLRKQASNYKIILILYLKNSFFNNLHEFMVPSQHIFEVIIPELEPPLLGAVWIFQERTNDQTVCSFWDYNNQPGLWIQDNTSTETDSQQVCTFSRLGHLAFTKADITNVTEDLIDIFESNSSVLEIMTGLSTVSQKFNTFVPFDVFMIGKILEKVNGDKKVDLNLLAATVNNLHSIEKQTLEKSQMERKATDTILQHVDKIIRNHDYQSRVEILNDNFMLFITDLKTSNFSGLLLLENDQTIQAQILEEEFEIEEIVNYKNLSSAVLLDAELKNQLESEAKVIITVFTSDALFNEKKSRPKHVTKIFGVILPELEEYKGPISVLHKVAQNNYEQECVHWLFNQTVEGSWFKDQTAQDSSTLTHCQFWHTTHFALLLLDQEKYDTDQILNWITSINCTLSLFGLFCIILTGIFFKRWRKNAGNQILLNFVFAMILQISFFYVASSVNHEDYWLCTSVGITLHYFTISEFCWMLVIAFLQYKRFVFVLGGPPQHILLKSCFVGWILPLVPVASVFIFNQKTYISSEVGLCYPSGHELYFGVWLPISLIVTINFILFIYIIYSVYTSKSECGKVGSSEAIFQWRLGILLFSMFGLTWIFGFLAELGFGKFFSYMFSLTATLQGFVLFLFFLIFNINTKYLYAQVFRKLCNKKI